MAKYKHLYEQTSVMLAKYQDELIPQYRKIIEGLEADNERLRDMWAKAVSDASKADAQIPKWIPVTERLPDKDGKYLAFNKGIVAGSGYCRVLGFAKDARKIDQYDFVEDWQNVWYFYDSEYGYVTTNSVTHWMPLPEPPKGE